MRILIFDDDSDYIGLEKGNSFRLYNKRISKKNFVKSFKSVEEIESFVRLRHLEELELFIKELEEEGVFF